MGNRASYGAVLYVLALTHVLTSLNVWNFASVECTGLWKVSIMYMQQHLLNIMTVAYLPHGSSLVSVLVLVRNSNPAFFLKWPCMSHPKQLKCSCRCVGTIIWGFTVTIVCRRQMETPLRWRRTPVHCILKIRSILLSDSDLSCHSSRSVSCIEN